MTRITFFFTQAKRARSNEAPRKYAINVTVQRVPVHTEIATLHNDEWRA